MSAIVDAVVIGTGILGCAIAFGLEQVGLRRVAVVDRGPLVSGMTRRSAGLVHSLQSEAATRRLAQSSLETYRHWVTAVGGGCGFVECGTIVTTQDQDGARELIDRAAEQKQAGVDVQVLERDELVSAFPQAAFKDVVVGAYEPGSGYVDPVLAAQALASRARERGAHFQTGSHVKQIGQERGRITQITTTTGTIQSPIVIIAAAAGAEALLLPLGITLPVSARRGTVAFFDQPDTLAAGHPSFVDTRAASFVRPHSFHLSVVGITESGRLRKSSDTIDETVTVRETEEMASLAGERVPALAQMPLKRSHAILYDRLADGRPGIGPLPGFDGLYIVAGFGESAVAVAPAAGRAIGEFVLDGQSRLDLTALQLTRPGILRS